MLRTTEVMVDGVRSPVLEGGHRTSEEAVVLVHGNPGFSGDWRALSEPLSAFVRTVAPDMPGYGDADKPDGFDYTVEGYARHLGGVLDSLGVRRAHLVLHDFGGPWGLTWAAAHPASVASLTLINIGVLPGYRWHVFARMWRTPVLGELVMASTSRFGFRTFLRRNGPRGLPLAMIDQMYDRYDRGTRRAVLRLYRATDDLSAQPERWANALKSLQLPVLVIWGRADPFVSASYAEQQRNYFPKAKVVMFDDSGHWPFADNPERSAAEIVPFIKACVGSGAAAS